MRNYKGSKLNIGNHLKVLIRECTENNSILERPRWKEFKDPHDSDRDFLAIGLTKLVLDTLYFNKATRVFIEDFYIGKTEVYAKITDMGIDIPYYTMQSRIRADLLKFVDDFGESIIMDIFENTSVGVGKYIKTLDRIEKVLDGKECALDDLGTLVIPQGRALSSDSTVDELAFKKFCDTVSVYTKDYVEAVERGLDKDVCWYARKLLIEGASNEAEERHLKMLKDLLNIKE